MKQNVYYYFTPGDDRAFAQMSMTEERKEALEAQGYKVVSFEVERPDAASGSLGSIALTPDPVPAEPVHIWHWEPAGEGTIQATHSRHPDLVRNEVHNALGEAGLGDYEWLTFERDAIPFDQRSKLVFSAMHGSSEGYMVFVYLIRFKDERVPAWQAEAHLLLTIKAFDGMDRAWKRARFLEHLLMF
jgi:hypothetical protein